MTQASETAEMLSLVENSVNAFLNQAGSRAAGEAGAPALWREIVEMGLPLVALPEAKGGSGLGASGFVCVARLFGKALILPPFIACGIAPAAAMGARDDGAFADTLSRLISDASAQVAFSSHDQGNPAQLKGNRITGQWTLVPVSATHLLVAVGDSLCLVSLDQAGIARDEKKALDGSLIATVSLDATEALHIEPSGSATAAALATSKLGHAALLHGMAEGAFGLTQDYIRTRVQFDQTISGFQSIQHRSVDQFMANALTAASIDAATTAFDADPTAPATSALIAAALARASTSAAHVARESVQMHGAIGFTAEADIGRYVRAMTGMTNLHGTARENRRKFALLEGALG